MRYIDENGNFIPEPDPSSGWGESTEIVIAHHEAEEAVPEIRHYEVTHVYRNGGQDIRKVIDVPGHPYIPAWDEYETVILWHFYPPVNTVLAETNLEAGMFASVGGGWYEILENIPRGCTLMEGRNARKTTIEEQLEKLKEQT